MAMMPFPALPKKDRPQQKGQGHHDGRPANDGCLVKSIVWLARDKIL
jgi:hypothetical protein